MNNCYVKEVTLGDTSLYYKEALQELSYQLLFDKNQKTAASYRENNNITELEKIIMEEKSKISERKFYYNAGIAMCKVFTRVNREGYIDPFNACIGGMIDFEDFIGVDLSSGRCKSEIEKDGYEWQLKNH